jgi:hypothetical protein
MSTAAFPSADRPVLIHSRKAQSVPGQAFLPLPSLAKGRAASNVGDPTIRRITGTHHGRTLLTLGHAAEYLVTSRRYSTKTLNWEAEVEAVHILMGLSRSVFEEYAERRSLHRRFEDWLIERAVRVFE